MENGTVKQLSLADRIRSMTDEELSDFIFVSTRMVDLSKLYCHGDRGCVVDGDILCDDAREKACILSWLRGEGELLARKDTE